MRVFTPLGAPKFFPLWVCPPHQCAKFGTFAPRGWEGEFFENSQTCDLELEDQIGATSPGKLVIDIDLVLAPCYHQLAGAVPAGVIFRSVAPTRQGAPPNDPSLLPVSADFARSISAPFGLPPPGLPPIGLTPLDSDHAKCPQE